MNFDDDNNFINTFLIYLFAVLILYFLYHITAGEYGIISYVSSRSSLHKKKEFLESVQKDMDFQKSKINKMKGPYVDADILDEEIRKKFGYAKKNEIVIYTKEISQNSESQ